MARGPPDPGLDRRCSCGRRHRSRRADGRWGAALLRVAVGRPLYRPAHRQPPDHHLRPVFRRRSFQAGGQPAGGGQGRAHCRRWTHGRHRDGKADADGDRSAGPVPHLRTHRSDVAVLAATGGGRTAGCIASRTAGDSSSCRVASGNRAARIGPAAASPSSRGPPGRGGATLGTPGHSDTSCRVTACDTPPLRRLRDRRRQFLRSPLRHLRPRLSRPTHRPVSRRLRRPHLRRRGLRCRPPTASSRLLPPRRPLLPCLRLRPRAYRKPRRWRRLPLRRCRALRSRSRRCRGAKR